MHAFFDPFCHPLSKPVAKGSNVPLQLFPIQISDEWILATGFWVDTNSWNDSESWID